jgi:hypothetical protein
MRKLMCALAMVCLAFSAVSSAAVITDDFSVDHDYLADGTAGTIWDGLAVNDGLSGTGDTVVIAAEATGGVLNLQSRLGNWEGGDDDGLFLYIDVAAGSDFVANVYVSDYTYVDYHDIGLMALVPGTQDCVMLRYFDAFGIRNRMRSTDDGNTDNNFPSSNALYPYLQLEKAGAQFTVRVSADGVTYTDLNTLERLDMENEPLRVGLYQATFSGNTGNVSFDDFSLEAPSKVATGPNPANGEILVPITTQLSWSAPDDYVPVGYDVWFGTEPNALNVNYDMEKIVAKQNVLTADPTTHSAIGSELDNDKDYFWYVDAYEPNGLSSFLHPGDLWTFTTAPASPLITKEPISVTVAAGAQANLSVTALNASSYEWFRSDDAVVGDDTSVGTGNPLNATINGVADEGWYYCVASGVGDPDTSKMARVMTKRLVGYWDFEGDLADSVPAGPTHDGTAADPNFAAGVPGLGSQGYQFFGDGRVVTVADSVDYFNFYPQGLTVACWVKGSNVSIWDTVISKQYEREISFQVGKGWWLGNTDGSAGVFGIRPGQAFGAAVSPSIWNYLVGVYDPDADVIRVYVNGQLGGVVPAVPTSASNLAPLVFGAESTDGTVGPSSATLDDVKIYSYALDSNAIAQQYVDVMGGYICVDGVRPVADLSGDCQVTLDDVAILALHWLESNRVE